MRLSFLVLCASGAAAEEVEDLENSTVRGAYLLVWLQQQACVRRYLWAFRFLNTQEREHERISP